ncbi:MAG: hypothetical protein D3909_14160 [Candidatus Electrothrix sp. ATG1]|nr:hypothetical protein [Candidatus Electrothrix sp. ATG1]
MYDTDTAVLTFIGVITGALFGPVCDSVAQRWVLRDAKRTLANGLALLCAANGFWVLSFITWQGENTYHPQFIITAALWIGALLFFRGALTQFLGAEINNKEKQVRTGLHYLIGGNILWLLGDALEGIFHLFNPDNLQWWLWGKYACYFAAALVLLAALCTHRKTIS